MSARADVAAKVRQLVEWIAADATALHPVEAADALVSVAGLLASDDVALPEELRNPLTRDLVFWALRGWAFQLAGTGAFQERERTARNLAHLAELLDPRPMSAR